MVKLSEINKRRIFDANSNHIGTASDIMIDPAEGRVKFLIKDNANSMLRMDRDRAKEFIRKNFIPIEKLKAVGNIIVVGD